MEEYRGRMGDKLVSSIRVCRFVFSSVYIISIAQLVGTACRHMRNLIFPHWSTSNLMMSLSTWSFQPVNQIMNLEISLSPLLSLRP